MLAHLREGKGLEIASIAVYSVYVTRRLSALLLGVEEHPLTPLNPQRL